MTDPFLNASPIYRAAQRTNQARGHGWNFDPIDVAPVWVRALDGLISAFGKPYVWFALAMLAGSFSLFWMV